MRGDRPRPKGIRRVERWAVGVIMAIVAFVLERVVLRTVRKRGEPEGEPEPTTFTSRGSEVDLPD
ncbi:MAG TPA: hypothetical protein VIB62_07145 [Actinomycetota bacterium]|jgi:hypothetical protein